MEPEETSIKIQYNNLWKLVIDTNINKVQLRDKASNSSNSLTKLGKNEPVHMDVLMKIATELDCKVEDIFEITP